MQGSSGLPAVGGLYAAEEPKSTGRSACATEGSGQRDKPAATWWEPMAGRVSAGKLAGIIAGCVVVAVMVFMMVAILSGLLSGEP
jgi:hypothetical protein